MEAFDAPKVEFLILELLCRDSFVNVAEIDLNLNLSHLLKPKLHSTQNKCLHNSRFNVTVIRIQEDTLR